MKQDQLIGLVDRGIDPSEYVVSIADKLAEERRLLHVAVSRACNELLVTAVDSPDDEGVPSPFVAELIDAFGEGVQEDSSESDSGRSAGNGEAVNGETEDSGERGADEGPSVCVEYPDAVDLRVLSIGALLAELRRAAVSPEETETRRRQAARQLARMAEAGVEGAHPDSWWGLRPPTTTAPVAEVAPIVVNPSKVERALKCPLMAMLDKPAPNSAMRLGSMFHLAAEALSKGVSVPEATEEMRRVFNLLSDDPQWRKDQEIERWVDALQAWDQWISAKQDVGAEVRVKVALDEEVTVVGRIDRLIEDADGALQIIDIKTAKNPVSKQEAEEHAQLATYQLALSKGRLRKVDDRAEIVEGSGTGIDQSGAYLVYPRKPTRNSITTREQSKLTEEKLKVWSGRISKAAKAVVGPGAMAVAGDHCDFCSLRKACPAAEGRR